MSRRSWLDLNDAQLFTVATGWLLHEIDAILARALYGMTSGWSRWEGSRAADIQPRGR